MKLVVLAFLAVVVAGCGGHGGMSRSDVESIIRSQLAGSVMQTYGEAVVVNDVVCVSKGGGEFDCTASVTGTNGIGGTSVVSIPVSASCDSDNCTWRSSP